MIKEKTSVPALVVKDKVEGIFDPVELIKSHGETESMLLESADVVTKLGEKSIVLLDLALKIEAKGTIVMIEALRSEGHIMLSLLAHRLAPWIQSVTKDILTLIYEPLYNELDVLAKMRMPSQLDVLRAILQAIEIDKEYHPALMLSGVFSYDFLDHFEQLPKASNDMLDFPNYLFYLPLSVIVIEHRLKACSIFCWSPESIGAQKNIKARLDSIKKEIVQAKNKFVAEQSIVPRISELDSNSFTAHVNDEDFGHLIEECKAHINAGDVYQIVPSRTFSRSVKDSLQCYQALRRLNPSPHMFFVSSKEWTLLGASPETFIKVDQGGRRVFIRPIAGTRRRGLDEEGHIDEELDAREQVSLCLDEKELAEHMMLVDLARNDIASVAEPGSRRIRRLLGVDRFSHVMHLVSEVEGTLKEGYDALSAYQASMNMGTLMGAPKVRAAQLLRNLEHTKRGFYGGAVGYINKAGDMDTAIIIRSALVKNGTAFVRAGCGVVYDSNIEFETRETINKAEAVLKALELAHTL